MFQHVRRLSHDVDVSDSTPIKLHPYGLNPVKEQLLYLKKEIVYLLDNSLIEPILFSAFSFQSQMETIES